MNWDQDELVVSKLDAKEINSPSSADKEAYVGGWVGVVVECTGTVAVGTANDVVAWKGRLGVMDVVEGTGAVDGETKRGIVVCCCDDGKCCCGDGWCCCWVDGSLGSMVDKEQIIGNKTGECVVNGTLLCITGQSTRD